MVFTKHSRFSAGTSSISVMGDVQNVGDSVFVASGGAREATVKALERLGPRIVGNRILIKPNLASRVRDMGKNTSVDVVEGVVDYFHGKGDLIVAEGCCGSTNLKPDSTYELFEYAFYTKLEDEYGVRLLDLNADRFERVKLHDKVLGVARTVLEADYVVTVPVLETHVYTTVSACVKNLMGCLEPVPAEGCETATKWGIHSELYDCDPSSLTDYLVALGKFEWRLIELYRVVSPKLGVIDAVVASEGDAPVHGTPVHMGMVIASENPVSCDAVAAYLMGVDLADVGFLRIANEQGLGEIDVGKIRTNVDLEPLVRRFQLPATIEHLRRSRVDC